jgi:hypothetical protein
LPSGFEDTCVVVVVVVLVLVPVLVLVLVLVLVHIKNTQPRRCVFTHTIGHGRARAVSRARPHLLSGQV